MMHLNVSQNSAIKGKGTHPSVCTYCTTFRKKCQADFDEKYMQAASITAFC